MCSVSGTTSVLELPPADDSDAFGEKFASAVGARLQAAVARSTSSSDPTSSGRGNNASGLDVDAGGDDAAGEGGTLDV